MYSMNRLTILVLLLGLLYALYTYQQQILSLNLFSEENIKKPIKKKKLNKNPKAKTKKENKQLEINNLPKDDDSDKISLSGISQVSLGSLADVESNDNFDYKPESVVDELESRNSLGSLISEQSNDFFFSK